jgi:hypothetical protein
LETLRQIGIGDPDAFAVQLARLRGFVFGNGDFVPGLSR